MKKVFFMCVAALAMMTVSCAHHGHRGHHSHDCKAGCSLEKDGSHNCKGECRLEKKGCHSDAACKDGQCPMDKKEGKKSCCCVSAKKVWFIEPLDGATVGKKFTVKFGIKGMEIQPAGQIKEMTGHHHLLVNAKDVGTGTVIPADQKHIHFGKGQTETTLELPPGKHELTLQFADGAHMSYGEEMRAKITVNVQ